MSHRTTKIFSRVLAFLFLAAQAAVAVQAPDEEPPAEKPQAESKDGEETVYKNTIKWATATELDNFGYDVYRGKSEEGPFECITSEPIPGAGTTDEPSYYQYVDDTIDPYEKYWYYVESISINGDRERFTPIYSAKPKLQRESSNSDSEEEGEG